MKYVMIMLLAVLASFSASAVLVREQDEAASKELGASFKFVAWAVVYDANGNRIGRSTAVVVSNDTTNGAVLIGAHHGFTLGMDTSSEKCPIIRIGLGPNMKDDLANGDFLTIDSSKVVFHPDQDIAVIMLGQPLYGSDRNLIEPVKISVDRPSYGNVFTIVGYGDNGDPSLGSIYGTGKDDGIVRGATEEFRIFLVSTPSVGVLRYVTSTSVPGIAAPGDSGGPVLRRLADQTLELAGLVKEGRGAGTDTSTCFEFLGYHSDFQSWLAEVIAASAVDDEAPTGTLIINDNTAYTNSTIVTLSLSATDTGGSGVADMSFSSDGIDWSDWEAYAASATFELVGENGVKVVYIQYRDGAGNVSEIASASIVLDTTPPVGTVVINGGAQYTNSSTVVLTISATDEESGSGVAAMRFSADGNTWYDWEAYTATTTFALPAGDGPRTVYSQFQDVAGNSSSTEVANIVLDNTPPTASEQTVSTHMNSRVAIALTGGDGETAAVVTEPSHGTFAAGRYTPNANFVGNDSLTYKMTDLAGNSAAAVVTITVTDSAPVASSQTVKTTANTPVTVKLSASDPDGDALSVSGGSGPTHGTLSGSGATLTYTPQKGYVGSDSFSFSASDGVLSGSGTVTITVAQAPSTDWFSQFLNWLAQLFEALFGF